MSQSALGAYGLNIVGLAGAEEWMQALPHCSPPLRVETAREATPNLEGSSLDGTTADLRLVGGGRLRMRRGDERAVFSFPEPPREIAVDLGISTETLGCGCAGPRSTAAGGKG